MRRQAGFWDFDARHVRLSEAGDPLEKLKKLLAESMLDVSTLREMLGKNF